MNLAWNDLSQNILHEKLRLQTTNPQIQEIVNKFNQAPLSKDDLDAGSYYIKSGYGQETVSLINQESKAKFPSKSFTDLKLNLQPKDIIAYAYFLKEVEYTNQFSTNDIPFQDTQVEGFYAKNDLQKRTIKVIDYQNDDHFIIAFQLKDNQDQLFLAKGYNMDTPQDIVTEINKYPSTQYNSMSNRDIFQAPNIDLNYRRDYQELIGQSLANAKFTDYQINQMYENIKFSMDNKGARVENEAIVAVEIGAILDPPKPKKFILNKPYWIIMKRTSSSNPYFILGINNTNLMTRK